jgi:hypothetical protein
MKKKCPQCENELPHTNEYFHKDSRSPSGLRNECKNCRLIKSKIKASDPEEKKRKADYRKQTRSHIREYKRLWEQNRSKTHPEFNLKKNLRSRIHTVLKYKKATKIDTTMRLVGCSLEYLIAYLEGKFTYGMTWENYGKWHVDHIRPCASFDLTDPEQQKQCFHYTNLQPLWAKDNLSKGDRY